MVAVGALMLMVALAATVGAVHGIAQNASSYECELSGQHATPCTAGGISSPSSDSEVADCQTEMCGFSGGALPQAWRAGRAQAEWLRLVVDVPCCRSRRSLNQCLPLPLTPAVFS